MLIVSGKGPVQSAEGRFPNAVIVAPDDDSAQRIAKGHLDEALRIAASARALLWIAAGEIAAAIPLDETGAVGADTQLTLHGTPITIARGSTIEIVHDGSEAGMIRVEASASINPSIRYFFPRGASIDSLNFGLFPSSAVPALRMMATLDPSRPLDAARNYAQMLGAAPVPSNFRTPNGQPLSIATTPLAHIKSAWDPKQKTTYLVPDGVWQFSGPTGQTRNAIDVLLGLSGTEFASVNPLWFANFVSGSPAYAPSFGSVTPAEFPLTAGSDPKNPITTSWLYFEPSPTGPAGPGAISTYVSQPSGAPYFQPDGSIAWPPFPIVAAEFPAGSGVYGAPAAAFPMAPYAGIEAPEGPTSGWIATARTFDSNVLSPARAAALYKLNASSPFGPTFGAPGATAMTPQGLYAQFTKEGWRWNLLTLASSAGQTLQLTDVNGNLREAFLSNQLFLVISDKAQLKGFLDDASQLTIHNWTFNLGPAQWAPPAGSTLTQTVMIAKFCDRDFDTVVNDLSLWTMPDSFNGPSAQTIQSQLKAFIADARNRAPNEPDLDDFVKTVLAPGKSAWNGILFLNVPVPSSAFPPQLRGLAAGLPPGGLVAHHLGINISPFSASGFNVTLNDSSLFALILYDNPGDLTPSGNPYDFKVLSLHVLFQNSAVAAFSSQIELLVEELFGEPAQLTGGQHGDNIIFNGLWQKHGSADSYSFTATGLNQFTMTSGVLDSITVADAQFVTLQPDSSSPQATASEFILGGSIAFKTLQGFDAFSFDALNYANMFVSMAYDPTRTPARTFEFQAGQVIFNSGSVARPGSLYANFPLQLTSMHQAGLLYPLPGPTGAVIGPTFSGPTALGPTASMTGQTTPADLGFLAIQSTVPQGPLGAVWFGVEMALNLGSPGALAPKTPFSAAMLAAWAPGPTDSPNVSLALKLPESDVGVKHIPLQGPLRLGVEAIEFFQNDSSYVMRFDNVTLQFLSLNLPPGGQANALLFGDPNPAAGSRSLGWYVAYKK